MKSSWRDSAWLLPAVFLFVLISDQISKVIVVQTLAGHQGVTIIPGCLSFRYAENTGGAFSIMADKPLLLTGVAALSMAIISVVLWKTPREHFWLRLGLTMMIAGAVGNLIDRVLRGFVVDFILAYIDKYAWPTFNIADSFICIGAGAVILYSFLVPEEKLAGSNTEELGDEGEAKKI